MTRRLLAALLLLIPCTVRAWDLRWQDEFDDTACTASSPCGLDPASWGYEVGRTRNGQLAYTTEDDRDNARVQDGVLVIEARRENYDWAGYTSATVWTKNKVDFREGRLELRIRMPATANSINAAAWLFGKNGGVVGWPDCGEIDLVEYVPGSGWGASRVSQAVHTAAFYGEDGIWDSIEIGDPWNWHTYSCEWTASRVDLYIDGRRRITKYRTDDPDDWPFDQRFFLLIGINVSEEWGAGGVETVDPGGFPVSMQVDYVRYYAGPGLTGHGKR